MSVPRPIEISCSISEIIGDHFPVLDVPDSVQQPAEAAGVLTTLDGQTAPRYSLAEQANASYVGLLYRPIRTHLTSLR